MNDLNRNPFEDDLADIAAGEEAAVERHLDLLSESNEAQDLRHDVGLLAAGIRGLGAGYQQTADFEARLLDALPEETKTEVAAAPKFDEPEQQDEQPEASDAKAEPAAPSPASSCLSVRTLSWAGGALAAGALAIVAASVGSSRVSSPSSGAQEHSLLGAQIIQIDRSANDGATGIEVIDHDSKASKPATVGMQIKPGDIVNTDARTRVVLQLSDDSQITLAAQSILSFDASEIRSVELRAGELVAEVAHLEDGPNATYRIPHGRIEVLGTKFSLSADGEHGNLRVLRGKVALHGDNQSRVTVHAGEEAVVDAENAPRVSPALHLAESIRWSELGPEAGDDRGGSGLGELRAYKPGQKRDRDWPMALEKHKVTVRLVGNIARTEIEEVFRNDSATVLEGVYKFPLPADAQIDKLSLDVDGRFEEGAIVERDRANKIWNGVIAKATHNKPARPQELIWVPGPWKDPALLEQKEGNRFELRIFPIPKRGTRTIKLAYTQVLAPQGERRRYTYPLPRSVDGSSVAENFSFDMKLSGVDANSYLRTPGYELQSSRDKHRAKLGFASKAFVPNGDLVVEYLPAGHSSELRAWGFQGSAATPPGVRQKKQGPRPEVLAEQVRLSQDPRAYALLAVRPVLPRWTEQHARDLVIVIDSSQSMVGERYQRASKAAVALLAVLDPRDRAIVMACDLDCQTFGDEALRPSGANARSLDAWLDKIEPSGASFLENTLERAAMASRSFDGDTQERERVVVYIGDGVASMGHRSLSVVSQSIGALRKSYDTTFTTVAIGADADSRTLGALARAGGGYFIERKSGRTPQHMALAVLESTMGVALRDAELVLPDSMSDISPVKLSTLRAGDEVLVSARYAKEIDSKVILRGTVGGKSYENTFPLHLALSTNAGNAFVPKIWASQTIERLEIEGKAGHSDTIVAMSKSFGVMSKKTSLLVLESEAMFRAFGVDRAKPMAQWTGEEGQAQVSESVGAVGYGDLAGETASMAARLGAGKGGFGMMGGGRGSAKSKKKKKKKKKMPRTNRAQNKAPSPSMSKDEFLGMPDMAEASRKPEPRDDRSRAQDVKRENRPASRPARRTRGGRWMQRVWTRVASIRRYRGVNQKIHAAVDKAEARLAENPDSRDRHRDLVQALSYADELARAEDIANRWLERDRLDSEALAYLADIAARRGRRDQSIRLLSGVVDLRPGDRSLHRRLAKAYDRAGDRARACAHRVMLAELAPLNSMVLGDALRCERANGRSAQSDAILAATPENLRKSADALANKPARRERIHGDLRIDANWTGGSDLDIAIITPTGRRISWQGGHRRVAATEVHQVGSESLGLPRLGKGRYLIEISRTHPEARAPVAGSVSVNVLGQRQRIPFELLADSKVLGAIRVRMTSSMVPL